MLGRYIDGVRLLVARLSGDIDDRNAVAVDAPPPWPQQTPRAVPKGAGRQVGQARGCSGAG